MILQKKIGNSFESALDQLNFMKMLDTIERVHGVAKSVIIYHDGAFLKYN